MDFFDLELFCLQNADLNMVSMRGWFFINYLELAM